MDHPIIDTFHFLGSIPTLHFMKAWDRSHRSFFFAIGTTRHKSSYGQFHYILFHYLGLVPTIHFIKGWDRSHRSFIFTNGTTETKYHTYILLRPGINPIGHFSLPLGPLDTKVHTDSPITNLFNDLGTIPTVNFYKGMGSIPKSFFFAIGTLNTVVHIYAHNWTLTQSLLKSTSIQKLEFVRIISSLDSWLLCLPVK